MIGQNGRESVGNGGKCTFRVVDAAADAPEPRAGFGAEFGLHVGFADGPQLASLQKSGLKVG